MILKTLQGQFPISKGVSHGKTILHFAIEGGPSRNAKAVATLAGKKPSRPLTSRLRELPTRPV